MIDCFSMKLETFPFEDDRQSIRGSGDPGFALAELLIAALILLLISSAVFSMLTETQFTAVSQVEAQGVLENTQIALQAIERHVRQAGNDPRNAGFAGITIVSPTEVQIQSDLTGSEGPRQPDKGDPDGDTNDSYENVTIRYNGIAKTLEIASGGGPAQIISGGISGLSFQYFDSDGNPTAAGNEVRRIRVSISGAGATPNPRTHEKFGMQLNSDIQIAAR